MTAISRRSPLALAILSLLENGPVHPYGMLEELRDGSLTWSNEDFLRFTGDQSAR